MSDYNDNEGVIDVDPSENEVPPPPDGIYEAELFQARRDRIPEDRESGPQGDPNDRLVVWGFRLLDEALEDSGNVGTVVWHRTNIEAKKGKIKPTYGEICAALGFNPRALPAGDITDTNPTPCRVRIATKRTNNGDFTNIKAVLPQ